MTNRIVAVVAVAFTLVACDDGPAAGPGATLDLAIVPDMRPMDAAPDAMVATRLWHVLPGSEGGDGSRERPFATPDEAYALARAGDLVWLLPADHPTPPPPPDGVVITGSGPDATRVAGPWALNRAGLEVRELAVLGGDPALRVLAETTLEAVRVGGDGVAVRVEGPLTARDLEVDGAVGLEVLVDGRATVRGGALRGTDAAVSNAGTVELTAIGATGADGVRTTGDARLEGVLIDGAGTGVRVEDGRCTIHDLTARRIAAEGAVGAAIRSSGGETIVEGLVVEGGDRGLRVDPQGVLRADGVIVREPSTDGLNVQGGEATVTGLRVESPGNAGVAVLDGATVALETLTVIEPGRAGLIVDRAAIEVRGAIVDDAAARGIALNQAIATFEGLIVRRAGDVGLQITDPFGDVAVSDGTFEDCGSNGVSVFGDGPTPVVLQGLRVEGTREGAGGIADGVYVFQGRAEIDGVISRGNAGAGVIFEQSTGSIAGSELADNADPGLVALDPSDPVHARSVVARGNGGAGLMAIGGTLVATDCLVEETGTSLVVGPGHGLWAVPGGRLEVSGGRSAGNVGSGVAFDPASTGAVSGIELVENQSFGLLISCGATVDEGDGITTRDNVAGDRSVCP